MDCRTSCLPLRTGDKVEEGEALEIFGLLIAELHDLVVALPQRLHAEPVPRVSLSSSSCAVSSCVSCSSDGASTPAAA